jgi:hypothetical protein
VMTERMGSPSAGWRTSETLSKRCGLITDAMEWGWQVLATKAAQRSLEALRSASAAARNAIRCMLLLGIVCTTQRILSEPLHQLRHHLLKAGRHVDANEPAFVVPVILEVMRHSAWN